MSSIQAKTTTAEGLNQVGTVLTVQPVYSDDAVMIADSVNKTVITLDKRGALALIAQLSAAVNNLIERDEV